MKRNVQTSAKRRECFKEARFKCGLVIILILILTNIVTLLLLSRSDSLDINILDTDNDIADDVRQYLNFDEAGPTPILSHTNILINAIPERRRIHQDYAEDMKYHLSKKFDSKTKAILGNQRRKRPRYDNQDKNAGVYNWNHDFDNDNRALYLQNPSILPLHNTLTMDNEDPDNLSDVDLNTLTGGDPSVRYLGFFSANLGGKCFGPNDHTLYATGETVAYYAVALLDEDLKEIDSVLIDLNAGPLAWNFKYWRQYVGDCRLVLIKGWIYGFCTEYILKFKIRRRQQDAEGDQEHNIHTGRNLTYPYLYPNIYGNGLEVILYSNQRSGKYRGKNFNTFRYRNDYFFQIWPSPHTFALIEVQNGTYTHLKIHSEQSSSLAIPRPSFDGPDTPNTIITCPENEDGSSKVWITNCTNAKTSPFFSDKDHGTSCCVRLKLGGRDVNVGISHQKTTGNVNPWWRRDIRAKYNDKITSSQYLSRFIAYDVHPPFDIVARSGFFCLGFEKNAKNMKYRLDLFGTTNACPSIHFPSTFSEVVGDPNRAIIGYGINDCTHNLIVVEKEEISRRLMKGK